jgi:hypothetical protein
MAAKDYSKGSAAGLSARFAGAVTPSDGTDLSYVTRAVFVGTGGNLEVNMAGNDTTVVLTGVPDGAFLPISVSRILDGNTTASNIVAFW